MTPQEAIEKLESRYMTHGEAGKDGYLECKAQNEAITLAISALEKQIPRKPIKRGSMFFQTYHCPTCDASGTNIYCWNCGQRLDWAE